MLAREIIESVRYSLSDVQANRWSDGRLLSLLNDGIADIAKTTILFTEYLFVEIINEQVEYDLSPYATKIVRVEFEDKPLDALSHNKMDEKYPNWQVEEATKPKAYIIDHQKEANFKLYPKVKNAAVDNIDFGGTFGIITGVTYSELQLNVSGTVGGLGAIAEKGFLKVFYVRRHAAVTQLTDAVLVSTLAKEPLTHYVVGRALRDNQDTQNRVMGNEELKLYYSQLEEYAIEKASSFSEVPFATAYRPGGA